jgi:hypothetical protein
VGCVWTAETCEPSYVIAGAGCDTIGVFDNMTGPEICAVAKTGDEVSFESFVEAERSGDQDMVITGVQGSGSAAFNLCRSALFGPVLRIMMG